MPGLYPHIPFCQAKCRYCDFCSFAGRAHLIPAMMGLTREAHLGAAARRDIPHNLGYWRNERYLGLGVATASYDGRPRLLSVYGDVIQQLLGM
ncbi:MAG: hypothetical protein ACP5G7_07700 [Anaerolineae bacterium]